MDCFNKYIILKVKDIEDALTAAELRNLCAILDRVNAYKSGEES